MLRKNSLFIPKGLRNTSSVSILTGGIDMKQIMSLVLALALTAALLTGCGCAANVSTHPGGMITEETTRPTVMPHPTATHETTRPTESRPHATMPTVTGSDPTGESGSGSMGSDIGGSGGTNGGTGTSESTTPTDGTMPQRGRPRNATR